MGFLMLGELTARQTSAAYHVGEIYGRFEWLHGRRRSAASPSYEIGRGRGLNGHDRSQDEAIEADFTGLQREPLRGVAEWPASGR
jgi:hypothetical protein